MKTADILWLESIENGVIAHTKQGLFFRECNPEFLEDMYSVHAGFKTDGSTFAYIDLSDGWNPMDYPDRYDPFHERVPSYEPQPQPMYDCEPCDQPDPDEEVYCEVCGHNYWADEPCLQH